MAPEVLSWRLTVTTSFDRFEGRHRHQVSRETTGEKVTFRMSVCLLQTLNLRHSLTRLKIQSVVSHVRVTNQISLDVRESTTRTGEKTVSPSCRRDDIKRFRVVSEVVVGLTIT